MTSRHVSELPITSLVPYGIAVVGPAVAEMAQRPQVALQSYSADTSGRATKAFEKAGIKPAAVVTVDGHYLVVNGTHTVMASAEGGLTRSHARST
jgi:hypothetical protein